MSLSLTAGVENVPVLTECPVHRRRRKRPRPHRGPRLSPPASKTSSFSPSVLVSHRRRRKRPRPHRVSLSLTAGVENVPVLTECPWSLLCVENVLVLTECPCLSRAGVKTSSFSPSVLVSHGRRRKRPRSHRVSLSLKSEGRQRSVPHPSAVSSRMGGIPRT